MCTKDCKQVFMAEEWATMQGGLKQLKIPKCHSVSVTLVMVQQFIVMSGITIQQHFSLFTPLSTGVGLQYQQHHCKIVASPPFCEISALFNHCQALYA